jgi:hypothetical protein
VTVVIYCTDRGQHRRRDLYVLTDPPAGLTLHRLIFGPGPHATNDAEHLETVAVRRMPRSGVETPLDRPLACPSCRRSPQLNGGTWRKLHDGLAARGESDVDMSRFPF